MQSFATYDACICGKCPIPPEPVGIRGCGNARVARDAYLNPSESLARDPWSGVGCKNYDIATLQQHLISIFTQATPKPKGYPL